MSNELFIRVTRAGPADTDGENWVRAEVIMNGLAVAEGFAPNYGTYKQEAVSARSAIALAQCHFMRKLNDIRYIGVDYSA